MILRLPLPFLFALSLLPAAESLNAKAVNPKIPIDQPSIDPEEQWTFDPKPNRNDIFYDREKYLEVLREISTRNGLGSGPSSLTVEAAAGKSDQADAILLAGQEQARIETLMVQRKYEEAKNSAEKTAKMLERFADVPEIIRILARIKTYQDQAEDALTRDEAQAVFDALAFKIQGILWAQSGARLVILEGESRALGINERVKDCVIINIDSDRVDFRFHYKRKRFEFPRYVGEEVRASK